MKIIVGFPHVHLLVCPAPAYKTLDVRARPSFIAKIHVSFLFFKIRSIKAVFMLTVRNGSVSLLVPTLFHTETVCIHLRCKDDYVSIDFGDCLSQY